MNETLDEKVARLAKTFGLTHEQVRAQLERTPDFRDYPAPPAVERERDDARFSAYGMGRRNALY